MKTRYTYFIVILLIVASFAAYGRVLGNDFVNYDDNLYITENNHIQSGLNPENITWSLTAVVSGNWHPLTLLSHSLDWSLFGANASGHHLVSLLLHIGSALLLFFFLNKTTKNIWAAAFAAALFALHPLRVESVAWASERKDVLSMFLGMASIYTYACYAESPKLSRYFLCFILFALSLMSKPMMVTLPFVLLLLDYWPLGRWPNEISAPVNIRGHLIGRLLWEKTPFIFLTIISSIVTLWTQNKGDLFTPIMRMSFTERIANAIIAYVSYLGKIFWPVNLAVFYPYEHSFALWQILCSCFILIGITIVIIYVMRKLPFLFVGWFWYLGTMIPVIGLVQAGKQAMADRYTYLPSIGVAIMLSWGIPLLFPRADIRKKILFPAGITCLAILAVLTWQQCGYWKNSTTLFNHALQVTKNNYLAQNNLASALSEEGKMEEAVDHYNKAINITSNPADVYNSRGTAYVKFGRYQRAIEDFNAAIRLQPENADAYYNRGVAYAALGRYQRAIEDYNKAILITPDDGDNYNDSETVCTKFGQYQRAVGNAYTGLGQYQRAIEDYSLAIRLTPEDADAHYNRGIAYYKLGQHQRAIEDFSQAIRLKPDDVLAYNNRGFAYFMQGNKELGCRDMQKTCELGNCTTLKVVKSRGYCR